MIYYRPTDGEVLSSKITVVPRSCFIMTQLGGEISDKVTTTRDRVCKIFNQFDIETVDANSVATSRDFLIKIWRLILSAPIGVAIVHEHMPVPTLCNIFYEVGMMQSYGKEVIIVKSKDISIPSDFIRTEYYKINSSLEAQLTKFCESLTPLSEYYIHMAEILEKNPILKIDYLRRAYGITGASDLKLQAQDTFEASDLGNRALNSVESLLVSF